MCGRARLESYPEHRPQGNVTHTLFTRTPLSQADSATGAPGLIFTPKMPNSYKNTGKSTLRLALGWFPLWNKNRTATSPLHSSLENRDTHRPGVPTAPGRRGLVHRGSSPRGSAPARRPSQSDTNTVTFYDSQIRRQSHYMTVRYEDSHMLCQDSQIRRQCMEGPRRVKAPLLTNAISSVPKQSDTKTVTSRAKTVRYEYSHIPCQDSQI